MGKIKKWMERVADWKFDKKMQLLVSVAIVLTTVIMLLVSTISTVMSIKKQSMELLKTQNDVIVENFESSLENYKMMAIATVIDTSVQDYVKCSNKTDLRSLKSIDNANNVLSSIVNMHSSLNFIAVVNNKLEDYLYKGNQNIYYSKFDKVYRADYGSSKKLHSSTLKMHYCNAYYERETYTLNLYFPVYDTNMVKKELGLLCMNITDPTLQQILASSPDSSAENEVVRQDGKIFASRAGKDIGKKVSYSDKLKKTEGAFTENGKLYLYEKVPDWELYVISSVSTYELYKGSIATIGFMAVIMLILIAVSILSVKAVIQMVYRPLDKVVRKMDDVASGFLKTRINVDHMGEDFIKLAVGFNSMLEEIEVLMEQVKLEQHQIEQIRLDALQSQIQPHFLYNTLDCIHWQAVADGNKEISTMVKALAKYYRICLSGGHDIIPLKMELEHVRNYLVIQNMRYDNIIGSEISVDSNAEETMIPKLTLQPLVENSIYHGMKVKEGKTGTVFIKVKRKGKDVLITLADTGTGMTQEEIDRMNEQLSQYEETFGYGVRNVNKRIQLLYGEEYGLYYLKNETGGVTVEIRLPYETEAKENVLRGEMIHV